MLTPIVSALTSTSPGPGAGVGTSVYSSTDGSPVRRSRMAFMASPRQNWPFDDAIAIFARPSGRRHRLMSRPGPD